MCPVDAFPDYKTHQTAKSGAKHIAAEGGELFYVGEKSPHFVTNGIKASMRFEATTKVTKPLAAASKIAEKGNLIVLGDAGHDSYI